MTVKRILILAPTLIIIFLLQSYLWAPTYEQQTTGNPQRMNEYITASIGDASLLNPILSADASSGQIKNLVFEGVIDRDEGLPLSPGSCTAGVCPREVVAWPEVARLAGRQRGEAPARDNLFRNET